MENDERIKALEDEAKKEKEKKIKELEKKLEEKNKNKNWKIKSIYVSILMLIIITLIGGYLLDIFGGKTISMFSNLIGISEDNKKLQFENKINKLQLQQVSQLVQLFELVKNPEKDNIIIKNITEGFKLINHSDDNFIVSLPIFRSICNKLKEDGFDAMMFGRIYWSTSGRPVWSSSKWTNETDLGIMKEFLKDKNIKVFFLGSNPGNIYLSKPFIGQTKGFLTISTKNSIPFIRDEQTILKVKNGDEDGNFEAIYEDGDLKMRYNFIEEDFYEKTINILKGKLPQITL